MTQKHWEIANGNISGVQTGGAGVGATVIGAAKGEPTLHIDESHRFAYGQSDPNHFAVWEDFAGDTIPDYVALDLSANTAAATISAAVGGVAQLSTGETDNEKATLSVGLNWHANGTEPLIFEAKVRTAEITTKTIEIGISDAVSETAGAAFSDHTIAGVTAVADSAFVVAFDTDDALTNWTVNYVDGGGTPGAADTGVAVTEDTWYTIRIFVYKNGNVAVTINGTVTNRIEDAFDLATPIVFAPWITLVSRDAADVSLDVDYVGMICGR